MRSVLIALGLGVVAYWFTRELIVGVLVTAAGIWFFRRLNLRPASDQAPSVAKPNSPRHAARDNEGIAVVCKQVTPERQEWVSVKTGRLFDVLSPDGPPGAKPGDSGEVIVRGTRYLVRTPSGS